MLAWRFVRAGALAAALITWAATAGAAQAAGTGSYVLTATNFGKGYAPTFTGNGRLGIRVPAAGQGYAGGSVPAQAELAGFYAKPDHAPKASESVQQRANIPTWSTLSFSDGGRTFSVSQGHTSAWRQTIDLHTGVISTSATWRAPDGHVTRLAYQVLTDRAHQYVGLVRLQLTPQWSGTATVTDLIDGSDAALSDKGAPHLTDGAGAGSSPSAHEDWVTVRAEGSGIEATLASVLAASANVSGTPTAVGGLSTQSVGQQLSFPVVAGQTYTFTKYVGVGDSQDGPNTVAAAQAAASSSATAGFDALLAANNAAWAQLWAGRIDVLGNRTVASDVNASEFYLWSSTRDGVDWSVSPAGLSSNGYDGHIFWDAETWMFPTLLAQHPSLAGAMEAYRVARLPAAEQHAVATGFRGARYPWESALDGTEQIPPPVSVNSEGLYEQHITADVALAMWQYFLTTGDRTWLQQQGLPALTGAATFWASRAVRGPDGRYHIHHVTGPDEENPNVADEAFTNAGAAATLRHAGEAARMLGLNVPPAWSQIAAGLVVPINRHRVHPEFAGYKGQLVKQADVTLLQYPGARPMPRAVAVNDLNYYIPRTDPMGPSMSDAVNSIDTSALGLGGCASYVDTERSYQPFIRDVFNQFSETSTGGAFTFMTGIGGFLQEFLYGYSGLRFGSGAVTVKPTLTSQLPGLVLHDLSWQGRRFTVSLGQRVTTVTLQSGAPLPLSTRAGKRVATMGHPVTVVTARPDLRPTPDRVRCGDARASSAAPGAPALAAVDGSVATDWEPVSLPSALTAPVRGSHRIRRAVVVWGRQWPAQPKPNVHPAPGPVIVRRPTRYAVLVSRDGRHWRQLTLVTGRHTGTSDRIPLGGARARFVRVRILSAKAKEIPLLQELRVTG